MGEGGGLAEAGPVQRIIARTFRLAPPARTTAPAEQHPVDEHADSHTLPSDEKEDEDDDEHSENEHGHDGHGGHR